MYYTRHERNMQDAFCNFLHIAGQMRHPRCSSPSYLYGSQFRRSTPLSICFKIHLSGLPKADKHSRMLLCTHPKLFVRGDISEIRTHYTSEYPALQNPVRRGIHIIVVWWDYLGSNRRPLRCERSALTNWAIAPCDTTYYSTTWEIC